jgi:hypothetical protein
MLLSRTLRKYVEQYALHICIRVHEHNTVHLKTSLQHQAWNKGLNLCQQCVQDEQNIALDTSVLTYSSSHTIIML